ncbi:MAG TPA: ribulose-phosphate 3-epimerase [Herpetosiphonaceae bacterium]
MPIATYRDRPVELTPSLLSADFARLGEQIREAEDAGCSWLQADVMDGHFVPNLTFGPPVLKLLRPYIRGYLDVHLMVSNPDDLLAEYAAAGADGLTVHWEACTHLHRTLQRIRELGCKAGVALNPATPVALLEDVIGEVDLVLIMSVNPGFGGQSFIGRSLEKLRQARALLERHGREAVLQIDGGVKPENARAIVEAGATNLVAGSAFFSADRSPAAAWERFEQALRG